MAVKNLARDLSRNSSESGQERYKFVEYQEETRANKVEDEIKLVKVVNLNPDVSSLDIIEKVADLTDPKQVQHINQRTTQSKKKTSNLRSSKG
jgi:hypothetical protein